MINKLPTTHQMRSAFSHNRPSAQQSGPKDPSPFHLPPTQPVSKVQKGVSVILPVTQPITLVSEMDKIDRRFSEQTTTGEQCHDSSDGQTRLMDQSFNSSFFTRQPMKSNSHLINDSTLNMAFLIDDSRIIDEVDLPKVSGNLLAPVRYAENKGHVKNATPSNGNPLERRA